MPVTEQKAFVERNIRGLDASLCRAITTMVRADSDPVRQSLFLHLRKTNRTVRLVVGLHERLGTSWLANALVSLYGLKSFLTFSTPPASKCPILAVAMFANARRQIVYTASLLEGEQVCEIRCGGKQLFSLGAFARLFGLVLRPARCFRYMRFA